MKSSQRASAFPETLSVTFSEVVPHLWIRLHRIAHAERIVSWDAKHSGYALLSKPADQESSDCFFSHFLPRSGELSGTAAAGAGR